MQIVAQTATLLWVIAALFSLASCSGASEYHPADAVDQARWEQSVKATFEEHRMPDVPTKIVSFDTTEGTLMNVDVSPDGTTLVFDLLGDIYSLPFDGGQATPLTKGRSWDTAPKYSLDGRFVYFISDKEGVKNVWRLMLSDQSLLRVTASATNIEGSLNWSHDGTRLLAARTGPDNIERIQQFIDPNTGVMTPIDAPSGPRFDRVANRRLRPSIRIFSAVQSNDGQIYFSQSHFENDLSLDAVRIYTFNLETERRQNLTPSDAQYNDYRPQLSHDGTLLAFFRQHKDRRTELWILDRSTGQERAITSLHDAEDASYGASHDARPNYAFTPDDRQLILWHGGKIHRVNLADGSMNIIPFHANVVREIWERTQPTTQHINDKGVARVTRWPSVSRDGQVVVFAAIGYVWVMDLTTQRTRRLTTSPDFETMPALSPDGKSIAYISFPEVQADYWPGRLMVADLDGGTPRQVLAAPNETFVLPSWSIDGQKIAVIRELHGPRNSERPAGIEAAFGWTPVVNGVFNEVAKAPASNNFFNAHIHARFVGFDESGTNLHYSFQSSETETTLATAALDGSGERLLAIGTSEVIGITPSPDLTHLALARLDESLWLIPFNAGAEPVDVSALASDARRVSDNGGYYIGWSGSEQIVFGFGQTIYRYRLDVGEREAIVVSVAFTKPKATQPIAFKGARLITLSDDTGAGPVIKSGTLVLDGHRISAVGPVNEVSIPSDAFVINAVGKTIMPGLLDVHYHRIGGGTGATMFAFKLPNADFDDPSALGYGVTTAWEPGGIWNDGAPATVDLQVAGRILGPRWSHSGQGGVGYPWGQLTSYEAALASVERRQALGVAVLKEYGTPTRQQQQWLSAAAHQKDLGIVSHIDNFEDMVTGIVDGFTGGDHSYIPIPFFKDVNELLRQSGYVWTPNIVLTYGSASEFKDAPRYFWQQAIKKYPLAMEKLRPLATTSRFERIQQAAFGQARVPYQSHRVSLLATQVAAAAKSGVHIGVSAHGMPALNLHGEMWYLWKGGMPIEDVLRATTVGNAEKLGLQEEVGSLEVGKMADFLVLDENPLDDIFNTLSLQYTVQAGVVYDSNTAKRVDVSSLAQRDHSETVH